MLGPTICCVLLSMDTGKLLAHVDDCINPLKIHRYSEHPMFMVGGYVFEVLNGLSGHILNSTAMKAVIEDDAVVPMTELLEAAE